MALVDYSDSDSDAEPVQKAPKPTQSASNTKKPFQKLIDRSGSGPNKIVVQLPTTSSADADTPEPPAKRAKIAMGGSRFSSFGSFLPPPKKTNATSAPAASSSGGSALAPGIHLKTGAEPAFARSSAKDFDDADDDSVPPATNGLNLPAPRKGPTIPEGQKPEEEVKLVGKPLMFKPLSVSRKPTKKKTVGSVAKTASAGAVPSSASSAQATPPPAPPPPKKVSLFSTDDDEPVKPAISNPEPSSAYEPLFSTDHPAAEDDENDVTSAYETYQAPAQPSAHSPSSSSLDNITSGLQLSAAAQRELFGRKGAASAADLTNARVVNFNMEREYEHNQALRSSGAEQVYNPVRSIAPGKHSLRQVVAMAQNNQSALEDSFAQGKNKKRDAAGRYGWS
ncbi:hypothetical protein OQA88_428 [Cercophora sp. LCS_1]